MDDSDSGESKKNERNREYESNEEFMEKENSNENINTENKNKLKKRIYTIKEKIKIATEAINSSINSCSKKYVIDRKCIRTWIRNIDYYKSLDKKNSRHNAPGGGRKLNTEIIEDKLVEFIKKYREIDVTVTSHKVVIEAIKLKPPLANNSYKNNMSWFYKFNKRQVFSIRNVIHVGKKLKEDSKDLTNTFFNIIYKKRNTYNIRENYCE